MAIIKFKPKCSSISILGKNINNKTFEEGMKTMLKAMVETLMLWEIEYKSQGEKHSIDNIHDLGNMILDNYRKMSLEGK